MNGKCRTVTHDSKAPPIGYIDSTHTHTHTHTHTYTHTHTHAYILTSWTKAVLRNQAHTSLLAKNYVLWTNDT